MSSSGGRRADRRRQRQQQRRRRLAVIIGGIVLVLAVAGVAYAFPPSFLSSPDPTLTPSRAPTPSPSASTAGPTAEEGQIDKAIVFILENHSAGQVTSGAPRLTALAEKFGDAPRALAPCGHPSQPNYVCLSAGGRYLSGNDIKTLSRPDIWNNALKAGRTMKMYADALPRDVGDRRKNVGRYAPRHVFTVPFVATPEKADNFARYTVHIDELAADIENGSLPNIGGVIPDNCHNAHDRCGSEGPTQLRQADDWIADRVELLQGGPDWKDERLLIVVTADEDNKDGANDIPMIVLHPSLKNYTTDVPVDLFSLGGLLADLGHTPRLGKHRTAPDFAEAFGLTVASK